VDLESNFMVLCYRANILLTILPSKLLLTSYLQIWARGTSVVGAGGESKPHALQVPLNISGTIVEPGDLAFCDPKNGVVIIPQSKVLDVISMLPGLCAADERVKDEVKQGMSVEEAFKKHRG
jgi:regulator of RNase E activity RraA